MNFELLAWGDGIDADFSDRVVVKGWDVEPSTSEINMEAGWFLCILEFDAVQQVSSGKPYYEVLKDSEWKRVYFMLREN